MKRKETVIGRDWNEGETKLTVLGLHRGEERRKRLKLIKTTREFLTHAGLGQ